MKNFGLFKKYLFLFAFSFALLINSCTDSSTGLPDFNLFPVSKDAELGEQLDAEIRSQPEEFPMLNNQYVTNYVNDILDDVLKSPEIEYSEEFDYNIQVIDSEVINAFAAPGGYLYFYTGLLKFLDNEAALASVIAHEVAHCEERHATIRISQQYGVSILTSIILGENPSQLEEIGANLLTGLGFLQNSRSDEYEADEMGFEYLLSTKWYPGGGLYFFNKVKSEKEAGYLEKLLSTHPMPDDRIEKLQELIDENSDKFGEPDENNLFSNRYADFKNQF